MAAAPPSRRRAILPGDRLVLLVALGGLAALSWAWLWFAPMPMPAVAGGLHSGRYAVLTFLMWFVMMIGMMLPAVAPTVLLFDRVNQRDRDSAGRTPPFLLGYLTVWLVFSVLATALQVALIGAGWIDEMGVLTERRATVVLLVAVGVYQWLPIKGVCLRRCQAPAQFLVAAFRPGRLGALQMGLRHGVYCLGCCWALMLLLFVGGVMNLLWVAALAGLVLFEKLLATGNGWRLASGAVALAAAGALAMR
ncbi:MAG: DUF2182 domain-containing protein [Gammaproteobacteria bacterium]